MDTIASLYDLFRQHPVVCTDTRKLSPGCLFFALKGAQFDGNKFATQALENGAAVAVVDDPAAKTDPRCVLVPDVLTALQELAAHHRRQFDIPIIAIGGSNGKTTTKELVAAVLSSHYPCHFTQGNLNNHIGVPLTLLAMPAATEVAVIEMGANHAGDIDQLCQIAMPTHGLITNIGKEHLEGFGSLEGVKKAEGELYRYLAKRKGCVFVNASEKYLGSMSRGNSHRVIYRASEVLKADSTEIEVKMLDAMPFVRAAFLDDHNEYHHVQSHLYGLHNFQNIMTAIALGIYFKVPAAKVKAAIEHYQPANNRSQIIHNGSNTILLDAYNANPSSMTAALESLNAMPASQKVAILGDMLELGAASQAEHKAILRQARRYAFDQVVVVGKEFGQCLSEKEKIRHFPDVDAAKVWFQQQQFRNTLLLIKGSRGIRLEALLA